MVNDPVTCFQEQYYEILQKIETDRSTANVEDKELTFTSEIVGPDKNKTAVVTDLYQSARELISVLKKDDFGLATDIAMEIVQACLDYLDNWGSHVPVTARERETKSVEAEERPPLRRLKELFEDKGDDYESEGVSYLSYCILGHWSIAHEVHKKAQRLYSVTKDDEPKFEDAEDTVFDLCNYALFFLAYLALPDDLEYEWVLVPI